LIFYSSKINSYKRVQDSPLNITDLLESHDSKTSSSYKDASATSATTAAAANTDVVASVQVEKKEPSSSSTITYPSFSASACHTSLNDMTISMAKYSSPPGSKSFLKHERIFAHATKFHILRQGNENNTFSDTIFLFQSVVTTRRMQSSTESSFFAPPYLRTRRDCVG